MESALIGTLDPIHQAAPPLLIQQNSESGRRRYIVPNVGEPNEVPGAQLMVVPRPCAGTTGRFIWPQKERIPGLNGVFGEGAKFRKSREVHRPIAVP